MYDFLINTGVQPLVADFIAHPEWLHIGSSALLMLMIIGMTYLIRVDIDPYIYRKPEPFSRLIERLIFYTAIISVLLWTYYGDWTWPDPPPSGLYYNKFTVGITCLLALVIGRSIYHFIAEKNKWDYFDNFPFYLMVVFQFFVPLVYYYQLERNGLMPKEELGFALAVIFLLYIIVRFLVGRSMKIPRNRMSTWFWIFIGYVLLTVIIMPYRLAAVKNVIQWVSFATCFYVGLALIPDQRRRDAIVLTIIAAAFVSTMWGFWKYFDIPHTWFGMQNGVYPDGHDLAGQSYFYKTPSAGRYFLLAGFFANPNYYGEWLILTIFLGLGLLFSTDSRNLRIFLSVVLAINLFEMVALYNRAGWLGGFIGLGFVGIGLMWARLPVFRRVSRAGFAIGMGVLILVLMLTGVIFNRRETDDTPLAFTPWERLKSMTDFSNDETFRNRLTMWRAAKMMLTDESAFPERLIFGGGLGFFEVEYLPYQTKVLDTYDFNEWFHNVIPTFRAHNDHLQMLVEAGLIGVGLYIWSFVMFFAMGFRYLKEEVDPARRFFALGILAATASVLATAFFSFPFHQIQSGGLIFTMMGFLVSEIAQSKQRRDELALAELSAEKEMSASRKGKKKKIAQAAPVPVEEAVAAPSIGQYFVKIEKKISPQIAAPLILFSVLLALWGVYTQVINFKSQYLVVKGIAALRNIDGQSTPEWKVKVGQVAADFFWRGYQLDPTNGRAEFFHGFSLIKKNTYDDVVRGTQHLEEGQLLYPQSDTFYALAMGYEARKELGSELEQITRGQIAQLEQDLLNSESPEEQANIQSQINELTAKADELAEDVVYSQNKAIDAYRTAAEYYPVKVEYYKELLRLLEEEKRYEDMIFWADRALVVDDWLLKKPPIRWQLYLWLGKAHRAVGAKLIQAEGDMEAGMDHWRSAEAALFAGQKLSNNVYFTYYELGQIYEALGDLASSDPARAAESRQYYEQARDQYLQTFNKKDNVQQGQAPFDYAYMLMGRIYEKLGDNERAVNYYTQLLTQSLYSPNTNTYQRARERIHELTGQWVGVGAEPGTVPEPVAAFEPEPV